MVTIDTDDVRLSTATSLIEALAALGVREWDLQRALRNPGRVRELAESLTAQAPHVPSKLRPAECEKLIATLLPAKIDAEGHKKAQKLRALYEDEREWLSTEQNVSWLLRQLTRTQLQVVLRRSGMDGGSILTAMELGIQMGLSANRVNHLRTEANKVMRNAALRLVDERRESTRY